MPTKTRAAREADAAADAEQQIDQLAGSLRLSIARLARLLRQQDRSELSPALATALASIWREGPITLSRLAALEQVTPPTVTKLVEKLERLGYIDRTVDPADRRVCRVAITPVGEATLDEIRTRRTEWLSAQLRELPARDLARLHDVAEVLEHLVRPPQATPPVSTTPTEPTTPTQHATP